MKNKRILWLVEGGGQSFASPQLSKCPLSRQKCSIEFFPRPDVLNHVLDSSESSRKSFVDSDRPGEVGDDNLLVSRYDKAEAELSRVKCTLIAILYTTPRGGGSHL